jgi:cobalamin biosynthesis Mg chelatase CobN
MKKHQLNNPLGAQATMLDVKLSTFIDDDDRAAIWNSANSLLDMADQGKRTVMGLGYVQSGKTTSITALCAAAADRGYSLVVAILGSTNLLKDQNRTRVEENLGLDDKNYNWYSISEFKGRRSGEPALHHGVHRRGGSR